MAACYCLPAVHDRGGTCNGNYAQEDKDFGVVQHCTVQARFTSSLRSQICDVCWGNEAITDYLATGNFSWRPLGPWRSISYRNPGGKPPGDYIGLNFYSR